MLIPAAPRVPKTGVFPTSASWLIFGPPKGGKSSLAADFPDPVIADLQKGYKQIGGYVSDIENMDQLKDFYDEVKADKGKRFKTVVIDPCDVLMDWVDVETCDYLSTKFKMQIENVGEAPNGVDWAESRKRFLGIIKAWQNLPNINKVFVCHSQAMMLEKGSLGDKAKTIDLPGKLKHRFPGNVDIIAYVFPKREVDGPKHTTKRYVSFQPYEDFEVGGRYVELADKVLPLTLPHPFGAIANCFKTKTNAVITRR